MKVAQVGSHRGKPRADIFRIVWTVDNPRIGGLLIFLRDAVLLSPVSFIFFLSHFFRGCYSAS